MNQCLIRITSLLQCYKGKPLLLRIYLCLTPGMKFPKCKDIAVQLRTIKSLKEFFFATYQWPYLVLQSMV